MESIMDAIRRYGNFVTTKSNSKNRRKQPKQQQTDETSRRIKISKSNIDNLTGAANALLLKGEVDIYDKTKRDILRGFPSLMKQVYGNVDTMTSLKTSNLKWEYQGNEDSQLHGPYTTEQIIAWVRSGYFVGTQRVKIRTICIQKHSVEEKVEPQPPTEDDLLADLMDNEDIDKASRPKKKRRDGWSTTVKG